MMNIHQEGWIGDKYYHNIAYVHANECDKEDFKEYVEKELECKIELITKIQEGYYRIKKSNKDTYEYEEYGEYCYIPCKKSRGAGLYYYAGFEFKDKE